MARIQVWVEYEEHVPVTPERIASFLHQLVESDAESRDYEERTGVLDPEDRAFTITDVSVGGK